MGQKDRLKCGALLCVARFFLLLYINSGNLTAISVMELMRLCINCDSKVIGRRDRIYCSSNCRKRYSENTQNSYSSKLKRDRNYRFFDRCSRLSEFYFSHPPFERLGLMQEWIELARSGKDKPLRDILLGIAFAIDCVLSNAHPKLLMNYAVGVRPV